MKHKRLNILSQIRSAFRHGLVLVSGLLVTTVVFATELSVEKYSLQEYTRQIDQHIAIVNQTKSVLDDPEAKPSALEQKTALCQRIEAYKNIQGLSQNHLDYENAFGMKMVAQLFLDQQQQSFAKAGMNESAFCGKAKK